MHSWRRTFAVIAVKMQDQLFEQNSILRGFSPAKIEQLSRVAPVLDLTESDELDSNQQVLQSFNHKQL